MIRLKPNPDNYFTCPECQTKDPLINKFIFESINIYADCTCHACDLEFAQILPVGHAVDYPMSFGIDNRKFYNKTDCPDWLSASVLKSHIEIRKERIVIEKIVFKHCDQVVILNTLDSLYGHVLLKLYNAFHHLNQDKKIGLIIIIPKIFKWLIPSGCAEAWVVDVKLGDLVYGYHFLQKFVADQLNQYEEVYVSKAYSHPVTTSADIEHLTGVAPFSLESFGNLRPVITFILREDRWWFNSPVDYWFYRICRKLNISSWGNKILAWRQNQLVRKVIKAIKLELPESTFHLIGLGKTGDFDGLAHDERRVSVNAEIEREWCRIYAMTHVVIGVHGSNMLLPTALAAGCVEILPEDRYGNMIQDITVRYTDRQQLFLYRFSDQFATPKSIANKAIAMISDYPVFRKNMLINTYRPSS